MTNPLESASVHAEWTPERLAQEVSTLDALSATDAAKRLQAMGEEDVDAILSYLVALEDSGEKYDKYSEIVDTFEEEEHNHEAEANSEKQEEEEEKGLLEKLGDIGDALGEGGEAYEKKLEALEGGGQDGLWARLDAFLSSYGGALTQFLKSLFGDEGGKDSSDSNIEGWDVPESYEGMPMLSRGCAIRLAEGVTPALRVTSPHGPRLSPLGGQNTKEFHAGVDIAAQEKSKIKGAELVSSEKIMVRKSRDGHGVIANIGGQEFTYYHVDPADFLTGTYQEIPEGKVFAKVSPTDAKSTAPHIHFAFTGNKKQNPDFAMPDSLRAGHRARQANLAGKIADAERSLGKALPVTTRAGHQDDHQFFA